VLATDPDESVKDDYMKAAGQGSIPTAFVVGKDTKIEWIGHPIRIDAALEAVVKDTWDRDAFGRVFEKRQDLAQARSDKDYANALTILDWLIEADGDSAAGYQYSKFRILLLNLDRPQAAYELGAGVVESSWDDAQMLNEIAWMVVDNKGVSVRDLKFAMNAAEQANELTDGKDPAILDTLARVYYEKGDLKTAVKWQRTAVKHAEGTPFEKQLGEQLEKYQEEAGG